MFIGLQLLIGGFSIALVSLYILVWRKNNLTHEIAGVILGFVGLFIYASHSVESAAQLKKRETSVALINTAKILARRSENMGHSSIPTGDNKETTAFKRQIASQNRWQDNDPLYAAVYTLRQTAPKEFRFIVSSSADYNQDGVISGDREQQIANGEIYTDYPEELDQAIKTKKTLCTEPYTDEWGSWVTVVEPMWDPSGKFDALMAVDFSASNWNSELFQARREASLIFVVLGLMFLGISVGVLHAVSSSRACRLDLASIEHIANESVLSFSLDKIKDDAA